jgi:hypothetical protein
MALDNKKYDAIHDKTGDGKNLLKEKFDESMHAIAVDHPDDFPELAAVLYQIGLMQEELDYLRSVINTNKDKATFPGLGTSSSTALAGNTTVISSGQASAITANTTKVSLVGGTGTALSFGEMITTPPPKGSKVSTYSIVMTAVKSGVSKSVTLTLT